MKISSQRLTFIDVARTYAVCLALLSHALIAVDFFDELGQGRLYIKQFTRLATPMFVFMFGFMIEFVYVRRAYDGNLASISSRIYIRSFQCYVAYALTSLCALIGGFKSLQGFVASLVFLSDSRFGNILRVYSVMLLLVPVIIKLRLTLGVKFLYLALVALLAAHASIDHLQGIDFGLLNKPLNIFFGIGQARGGPSILGAFLFCVSGMIVASSLLPFGEVFDRRATVCPWEQPEAPTEARIAERNAPLRRRLFRESVNPPRAVSRPVAFYQSIAVLASVLCIAGMILITESPAEAWEHFVDFSYRKVNAPGYFIIGTLYSLLVISIFHLAIGTRTIRKPFAYLMPLGTASLISYTAGNMLLNLFGSYFKTINPLLFLAGFFLAVLLITTNIRSLPFYENVLAFLSFDFAQAFKRTSR